MFVLEEESDPRRFSIHRLVHYCPDLGELYETDRVVPVVIFLRGQAPRRELVFGTERHAYLRFDFIAYELAAIAYEHFRDSDNIVARLNLPNLHHAPRHKIDAYAQAVKGLVDLEDNPEKQLKYIDFIDIYADLDDNERAEYQHDYPDEAKTMSRFSERFIEQGRQEGETTILLRQLQLKFGVVPEGVRRRIEHADPQTLQVWSERILTSG